MAETIDLAKPLKLTTPGTAPIAGVVVSNTEALEAIESPWPGMIVYVQADGKNYRITELKDVSLGAFTKKAVSKYEPVPDKSDLDGKASSDHTHKYDELTGVPPPTSGITLGIIKSYNPETGTATVQEANDDWTENPEGTIHENVVVP